MGVILLGCHVNGFLSKLIHGLRISSQLQQQTAHIQLSWSSSQLQSRLFFLFHVMTKISLMLSSLILSSY